MLQSEWMIFHAVLGCDSVLAMLIVKAGVVMLATPLIRQRGYHVGGHLFLKRWRIFEERCSEPFRGIVVEILAFSMANCIVCVRSVTATSISSVLRRGGFGVWLSPEGKRGERSLLF